VLLVSGQSTDDMRALDGNRRWRYLPKPFTPHDLAWTVRSLLDAPANAGRAHPVQLRRSEIV
jgi:hypothetical protein